MAAGEDRVRQSYHLERAALLCVAAGFTFFTAWFMTDALEPRWLHTSSQAAAAIVIAIGGVSFGFGAWGQDAARIQRHRSVTVRPA